MKRLIFIYLLLPFLIFSNHKCGEGMIGLLEIISPTGEVLMTTGYMFENGCEYVVDTIGYYETDIICGSNIIVDYGYDSLYVWKRCPGWPDYEEVIDPYSSGLVSSSLHNKYLIFICGE